MSVLMLNVVNNPQKTLNKRKKIDHSGPANKPGRASFPDNQGQRRGFRKKPFKRKWTTEKSEEVDEDEDKVVEEINKDAEEGPSGEGSFKRNINKPSRPFSSLFSYDSPFPLLEHKDVEPVSEAVFSSKFVKDLPIHPFSISNLEQNMGVKKVTVVQQLSYPVIMSEKDALIRSQTGSGKTLAYALPIVESLHSIRPKLQRSDGVRALVVVPTRELALQTYECFIKLVKPFTWIVPGYLIGGEKRKAEKARLRKGINILVGTPGRILDHILHTESLQLLNVNWFVIDEADRLLDMGYEKDIASLVRALNGQQFGNPDGELERFHPLDADAPEVDANTANKPERKRKTILLSATLTSAVDRLAGLALKHPKFVDAAAVLEENETGDMELIEQDLVIPETLKQWFMIIPPKLRLVTLASFIVWNCRMTEGKKMLIFMATQDMVDFHTELLTSILGTREKKSGDVDEDSDLEDEYGLLKKKDADEEEAEDPSLVDIDFFKLHGNMTQKERTDVFKTFRGTTSGVLLCTDVAARGLDLPLVDWIVQYTAPPTAADYVHRAGRTARVGTAGNAMLFLAPSESKFITHLEDRRVKIIEESMQKSLQSLVTSMGRTDPSLLRMRSGAVETAATQLQLRFEEAVSGREDLHDLACKAYVSFVRFYASYPRETRAVFGFKALHLGHYAKSFALRDPPSSIGGIGRKQWLDRQKNNKNAKSTDKQNRRSTKIPRSGGGPNFGDSGKARTFGDKPFGTKVSENRVKRLAVSEFASGLAPKNKKRKLEMNKFD